MHIKKPYVFIPKMTEAMDPASQSVIQNRVPKIPWPLYAMTNGRKAKERKGTCFRVNLIFVTAISTVAN